MSKSVIHSTPTFKRKIIDNLYKDYKNKNQFKMMEEVSNGIILNDIKNFDHDNSMKKMLNEKNVVDKNLDKGFLGKLISVKISKLKGWSPINDKDGFKKAKMILRATN